MLDWHRCCTLQGRVQNTIAGSTRSELDWPQATTTSRRTSMKKILICGMMLGLMTGVGFAQRGRAAGGVGPTAGMPSAPIGRTAPNAVTAVPRAPAPNAVSGPSNVKTVTPNATGADAAKTVAPNANSSDNAKTVAPNSKSADN